jgi:hypothetical protein
MGPLTAAAVSTGSGFGRSSPAAAAIASTAKALHAMRRTVLRLRSVFDSLTGLEYGNEVHPTQPPDDG